MSKVFSSEPIMKKLNQKKYMDELATLIGRPINSEEFGSLELANSIRQTCQKFSRSPSQIFEIPFSERCSDRFKRFISSLYDANHSPVYLWTPRTITCGTFLVPSVSDIKFEFDFSLNDEGMLVFLTSDLEDRLLLDFFESSTGDQILKIELQGPMWGKVIY